MFARRWGIVFFHPDGADELLAPSLPCGPCLAECECSSLIEAHSRGDFLALSSQLPDSGASLDMRWLKR